MRPPARLLLLPIAAAPLTGCVERRIEITSEPSGALVWVNDQQVGRTPAMAEFLYHGVYDVRLELEGYEPVLTEAEAKPPIYEHAPLDLVAEALPVDFENVQRWHFVLEPSLESTLPREQHEADLLERATAMRAAMKPVEQRSDDSAEESDTRPEQSD